MTEAAKSTPAVADLLARDHVYVEGSYAKQTLEAYDVDWKHFSGRAGRAVFHRSEL